MDFVCVCGDGNETKIEIKMITWALFYGIVYETIWMWWERRMEIRCYSTYLQTQKFQAEIIMNFLCFFSFFRLSVLFLTWLCVSAFVSEYSIVADVVVHSHFTEHIFRLFLSLSSSLLLSHTLYLSTSHQ